TTSPPRSISENKEDIFTTPEHTKTRKPFDYRRPAPTGPRECRRKQSSARNASVSLILDSFVRLTKKNHQRSARRTRRFRNAMSTLRGKKLPMLIAIGLAALCQSILTSLDASNSLNMLCGSSNPLVYGFTLDAISLTSFAQSMIAQG
ncbi:unnamed protein product, partial [Cylindrotheca closterium]